MNKASITPQPDSVNINSVSIFRRAKDGYINATAMCKAAEKQFNDYSRLKTTQDFIKALSGSTGIPVDLLIQTISTGANEYRGTLIHPKIAIHLAQWLSPEFAVKVTDWVFDWMAGGVKPTAAPYKMPAYLRRYQINRSKIPHTHFSMLDQITFKLFAALETHGYAVPDRLMPDISLGKIFSGWLREQGHDPDSFPTYQHVFADGKRPPVPARLYPNEMLSAFNLQINDWIETGKALKYFVERDPEAVKPLAIVCAEIKRLR